MYANLERWPATPSEGDNERAERAPRIVLMGSRRSGKTSMARVVFGKMSPHETLFVPSTAQPTLRLVANSDLVHFSIFDVPGDRDLSELRWRDAQMTPRDLFGRCVVLAYVVDAEADPYSECARLAEVAAAAKAANPRVQLEVFVHKVDGDHFLSEEQKLDCRREVEACARAELAELYAHGSDENVDPQQAQAYADDCLAGAAFSLTSIYDHSVFEAFSKLVSRALVPQRIVLRKMLDALVTACDMEKSFLFDVASKVYVATDSAPVDSASYELCADAIDVVLDVASIYAPDKTTPQEPSDGEEPTREEEPKPTRSNAASIQLSNGMALVLDEVDRNLALVCLLRTENLEKRDLIDYNLGCFRTALARLAALNASSAGK
jgi:Ras-related GTP-binding protein C/D